MTEREEGRLIALTEILGRPDASDLLGLGGQPRGRVYTCGRDTRRNPESIKYALGVAYVQWRYQDAVDVSSIVSVRRAARLKMVRRA